MTDSFCASWRELREGVKEKRKKGGGRKEKTNRNIFTKVDSNFQKVLFKSQENGREEERKKKKLKISQEEKVGYWGIYKKGKMRSRGTLYKFRVRRGSGSEMRWNLSAPAAI